MKLIPLITLAGLAMLTSICRAQVVFHETFSKGRETQNPPESLAWFATVPDSAKVENGALVLSGADESPRAIIATFPMVPLEPGDRLVLTFDFEVTGEVGLVNNALRVGLYNADFPPAEDGEDPETVATGYLVGLSNGRHSGNNEHYTGSTFFERLADEQQKANPKLTAYQNHVKVAASGIRPGFYERGISYSVEFTIEPVSDSRVRLGFRIQGGNFTDQNDFEAEAEGAHQRSFREFNTVDFIINASAGDAKGGFPEAAISNMKLDVIRK